MVDIITNVADVRQFQRSEGVLIPEVKRCQSFREMLFVAMVPHHLIPYVRRYVSLLLKGGSGPLPSSDPMFDGELGDFCEDKRNYGRVQLLMLSPKVREMTLRPHAYHSPSADSRKQGTKHDEC